MFKRKPATTEGISQRNSTFEGYPLTGSCLLLLFTLQSITIVRSPTLVFHEHEFEDSDVEHQQGPLLVPSAKEHETDSAGSQSAWARWGKTQGANFHKVVLDYAINALCKGEINGEQLRCCYAAAAASIGPCCFMSPTQSADKLTAEKSPVGTFHFFFILKKMWLKERTFEGPLGRSTIKSIDFSPMRKWIRMKKRTRLLYQRSVPTEILLPECIRAKKVWRAFTIWSPFQNGIPLRRRNEDFTSVSRHFFSHYGIW